MSQVAVSFVLLSCSALFLQSLFRTKTLDLGFQLDRLLLASFDLEMQNYGPARRAASKGTFWHTSRRCRARKR